MHATPPTHQYRETVGTSENDIHRTIRARAAACRSHVPFVVQMVSYTVRCGLFHTPSSPVTVEYIPTVCLESTDSGVPDPFFKKMDSWLLLHGQFVGPEALFLLVVVVVGIFYTRWPVHTP